jgi:pseudouridine-5'-phosphate glycosidase
MSGVQRRRSFSSFSIRGETMRTGPPLSVQAEVAAALAAGQPVVALESSLITHGLPWQVNLHTARAAENAVRREGAVPATIAVLQGRLMVGLDESQLQALADQRGAIKASRRDLASAIARGQTAGTTVAATMFVAHRAGIAVFATGGIGGAHRGTEHTWDISADLIEIARTPVAVVCAGAKSVLDVARTLEVLETHSVPVVGYRTDDFPAFYLRSSGERVSARVDSPKEAAELLAAHWGLGGAGVVLAQPLLADVALEETEFETALAEAERQATDAGVKGKQLTPFLLANLAEVTEGKTLRANQALVVANARLAAQIAWAFTQVCSRIQS